MSIADLLVSDETELAEHYATPAERHADGLVHAVGLLLALIGGALMLHAAFMRDVPILSAVAIYALCSMLMLAFSAVYNLTRPSPARRLLRRIDEAGIFLMIAGSYTPFAIKLLPPGIDLTVVTCVWIAALTGAAGKVLRPDLSDRFWCYVYLGFAWGSVLLVGPTLLALPMLSIALLIAGGVAMSLGVPIYLNHTLPFRRAIWHALVIVGAAAHYGAIFFGVVSPAM
ncbi:MAG: hemolysin III family protein [Caulobacterales bacterium]